MAQVVPASEIDRYLKSLKSPPLGCFVDTNLLFAADYEVHRLFDEAIELGEKILSHGIPIYSNYSGPRKLDRLLSYKMRGLVAGPGRGSESGKDPKETWDKAEVRRGA